MKQRYKHVFAKVVDRDYKGVVAFIIVLLIGLSVALLTYNFLGCNKELFRPSYIGHGGRAIYVEFKTFGDRGTKDVAARCDGGTVRYDSVVMYIVAYDVPKQAVIYRMVAQAGYKVHEYTFNWYPIKRVGERMAFYIVLIPKAIEL